jgi:nucleotide-binding universal stress UspA family protein
MPPTLRWALARIPMRKAEKQRLEREEQEAKGFVANLERLLVAVDDSSNGKFATRVAGILAGTRAMPATVMHITDPSKIQAKPPVRDEGEAVARGEKPEAKADKDDKPAPRTKAGEKAEKREQKKAQHAGEALKEAAEAIKSRQKEEEKVDTPVEVTTIVHEAPSATVIAEEAEKGYDLLVIGLDKTVAKKNELNNSVTGIALGFEGPIALSDVRGDLEKKPNEDLSILVPVNGTEVSRRGAEVAITLARAHQSPLTVLYVAQRSGKGRTPGSRRQEEAILKDIVAIADGYNMSIRTAVLADRAADEAIMREVERRKCNLVVLGVGRRPGEKLFFGDTAAALLEKSKSSLLFLAS